MAFAPDLRLLLAAPAGADLTPLDAAVARLSAAFEVDLTVLGLAGRPSAVRHEPAFPPVAGPRRVQRLDRGHEDPALAVAEACGRQRFDLVLAPPEPRLAVWRAWRGSLRARVLARAGVPLWTAGPGPRMVPTGTPIRQVACLIDFTLDPEPVLHRASAFARRVGGALRVIAMLPPVDDGLLVAALHAKAPLLPEAALCRIEHLCGSHFRPAVDVVVGGRRDALEAVRRAGLPDLLFVQARAWAGPWPVGISGALERAGCPVVLVPDPVRRIAWSFETPNTLVTGPVAFPRAHPERTGELSTWPAGSTATP